MAFHMNGYSNFHDDNQDWIVSKIKSIEDAEANTAESAEAAAESAAASQLSAEAALASQGAAHQSELNAAQSETNAAQSEHDASDIVENTLNQIAILQSRVDNIIPDGTQTAGNTELLDIRVGYDGKEYDSAGNAVRKQVSVLHSMTDPTYERTTNLADKNEFVTGKYVDANGNEGTSATYFHTGKIPVVAGLYYSCNVCRFITVFDSSDTVIQSSQNIRYFIPDPGASYVILSGLTTEIDSFMVNLGRYLNSYVPYEESKMKKLEKDTDESQHYLSDGVSYYLDGDNIIMLIKANTLAGSLNIYRDHNTAGVIASRVDFVNFADNKIGFYRPSAKATTDPLTVLEEKTISFQLVAGHQYMIESIRKNGNTATIRITDGFTGDTDELTIANSDAPGLSWGVRGYQEVGCDIDVIYIKKISTQPYNCKALIIGDSYIEGASIGTQKDKRWCALLRDALDGNVFINGLSGAPSLWCNQWLSTYLTGLVNPEYVFIQVGVNDGNFQGYKQNITACIDLIKNYYRATPVLMTIPPTTGSASENIWPDINNFVKNSGELYINEADALTVDNAGLVKNPALFAPDGIHPNIAGQKAIFDRIKIDLPEIFM